MGRYIPVPKPAVVFITQSSQFPSQNPQLSQRQKCLITVRCTVCRRSFGYTATGTPEVHFARHLKLFPECLSDSRVNRRWLKKFLNQQVTHRPKKRKSGHSTARQL